MRALLLLAAAASAQTRITNWEEQHQRFVRQAAFEDLLSWFRQRCVDAGGFVVPGLSQRPGGIRNVFLPNGAKKGDALWMRAHCPVSCGVVSGCTASSPKILVEDVSTETWTSVKAVVGDLLLALRDDEVLFVREVDGPADVTVVAS